MSLTINKGSISAELTPGDVLKYFGIGMPSIIEATSCAISNFNGWDSSLIKAKDLEGHEEEILDAILYEIKTDVLRNIVDEKSDNNFSLEINGESLGNYPSFEDARIVAEKIFDCKLKEVKITHNGEKVGVFLLKTDIDVDEICV